MELNLLSGLLLLALLCLAMLPFAIPGVLGSATGSGYRSFCYCCFDLVWLVAAGHQSGAA